LNEPVDTGVSSVIGKWADMVNEKVMDFHRERGHYPNIMLASRKTYDRIDTYCKANPENLSWVGDGEPPDFDGLGRFSAVNYHLELCIDENLKGGKVKLVYDETPKFDGEEAPTYGNDRRFSFFGGKRRFAYRKAV
jgi:hypothetical protein